MSLSRLKNTFFSVRMNDHKDRFIAKFENLISKLFVAHHNQKLKFVLEPTKSFTRLHSPQSI